MFINLLRKERKALCQCELAKLLGVSTSTFHKAMTNGEVESPAVRIGKRKYYSQEQVKAISALWFSK